MRSAKPGTKHLHPIVHRKVMNLLHHYSHEDLVSFTYDRLYDEIIAAELGELHTQEEEDNGNPISKKI